MESKNLKDDKNFKDIHINKDKTKEERSADRLLRKERNDRNSKLPKLDENGRHSDSYNGKNFYWGIRYGSLKKIYIK